RNEEEIGAVFHPPLNPVEVARAIRPRGRLRPELKQPGEESRVELRDVGYQRLEIAWHLCRAIHCRPLPFEDAYEPANELVPVLQMCVEVLSCSHAQEIAAHRSVKRAEVQFCDRARKPIPRNDFVVLVHYE